MLAQANPGLIYCAVSGYGRDGPLADKGGFDLIAQGFAGLMSITGEPGRPPVKNGNPVADINAGILAVAGIARRVRAQAARPGAGQIVDTSLMEAALQQTYWHAAIYFATGESPGPTGSAHLLTAPYQAFRASDGWINIGGANQANWERIADVLGHPEWRDDPRFATNSARMENLRRAGRRDERRARDAHAGRVDRRVRCRRRAGRAGALDRRSARASADARARHGRRPRPSARPARRKALGCPIHFSATPTAITRPAPMLGEHTREVLREHGYTDDDIDALAAEGVVEDASSPLPA